jgi:hypothetical protein
MLYGWATVSIAARDRWLRRTKSMMMQMVTSIAKGTIHTSLPCHYSDVRPWRIRLDVGSRGDRIRVGPNGTHSSSYWHVAGANHPVAEVFETAVVRAVVSRA